MPLSQRTGGHIHAGDGVHVGMALEVAVYMPQSGQILHREEAPVGQGSVQPWGRVAFAQDEAVPVCPFGILGIDPHFFEIQVGKHVRGGKTAAGMARLGSMGSFDNPHAHLTSNSLQMFLF